MAPVNGAFSDGRQTPVTQNGGFYWQRWQGPEAEVMTGGINKGHGRDDVFNVSMC